MNDAGKVAFTPKGDYDSAATYEYLDTVVYNGNAYVALKTTTGNTPTGESIIDENWKLLARGGTSVPMASEKTPGTVKASNDIGVTDDGSMVLKTDYTEQKNLTEIIHGEPRTTFFGKISKTVSDFIKHVSINATTDILGHVKLINSVNSTSTTTAAVPASVKTAYEKAAAALPKANISSSSAITTAGAYALDAREKNANLPGTLAYSIQLVDASIPIIDRGTAVVLAVAGQPSKTHVYFNKKFAVPPTVVITPVTSVPGTQVLGGAINNVTAAGFDIVATRKDTYELGFHWVAIGG